MVYAIQLKCHWGRSVAFIKRGIVYGCHRTVPLGQNYAVKDWYWRVYRVCYTRTRTNNGRVSLVQGSVYAQLCLYMSLG